MAMQLFGSAAGWRWCVVGLKGGFGGGGKWRWRLALKAVGSAAGEREGWLSVLVCSVMEAGGEDDAGCGGWAPVVVCLMGGFDDGRKWRWSVVLKALRSTAGEREKDGYRWWRGRLAVVIKGEVIVQRSGEMDVQREIGVFWAV
ncbi:hypothetical protein Peur_024572 [Populus x canadensis]